MRSFRRQPSAFAGNGAKRTLRRRGWDGRTRTYNIRVKVWCVTVTLHPTIEALRKEAGFPASRSRGVGDGARTHDTRNHNPVLIPTELHPPLFALLARQEGFEPPAYCLEGSCSILLSYWRMWPEQQYRRNARPQALI